MGGVHAGVDSKPMRAQSGIGDVGEAGPVVSYAQLVRAPGKFIGFSDVGILPSCPPPSPMKPSNDEGTHLLLTVMGLFQLFNRVMYIYTFDYTEDMRNVFVSSFR